MNREQTLQEIYNIQEKNLLLELPTGYGKSRIALELIKEYKNVLILVNRVVHKSNWSAEIHKWLPNNNIKFTMITYTSIHKAVGNYDAVIYDECHHLSERCREFVPSIKAERSILLSATVSRNLKRELQLLFSPLHLYSITLKKAITDKVLPDPKVFLLPLYLNSTENTEIIKKNPKATGKLIECNFAERWNYIRQKTNPVNIHCTERQYMNDLDNTIEWFKKKAMTSRNEAIKNHWLRLCGDRLKYLSTKKTNIVYEILNMLKDKRTLTFCNNILQTEILGKYCINSKNDKSVHYLSMFNSGKIKHITACNILNEGRQTCPYPSNSVEVIYINKLRKKA
jgi:superfamily II DNA or RNA helicase